MSRFKGYFLGVTSAVTYGFIPVLSYPLLREGLSVSSILFYRFLLASIILLFFLKYRKESLRISLKDILPIISLGLLYASSSFTLFWSFDYLAGGVAATIMFLYPVFVTIIMALVFKEKTSLITVVSILLGMSGVFLLYMGDGGERLHLFGVILALISGFSYGGYIIFVNKNKRISAFSGLKTTFYSCLSTSIFFLVGSSFSEGLQPITTPISIFCIIALAVVATALSCLTLAIAVRIVGSTTMSVLGALEPVSAVVCGLLFLKEPLSSSLVIGILFIVGSVMILVFRRRIT